MPQTGYATPKLYPDANLFDDNDAYLAAVREYFRLYERKIWLPKDLQPFPYKKVYFGVLGFRPHDAERVVFSKLLIKSTVSRSRSLLYDMANLALHDTQDRELMVKITEAREARFQEIGVINRHFRARLEVYMSAVRSHDALLAQDFVNAWEKEIDPPDADV